MNKLTLWLLLLVCTPVIAVELQSYTATDREVIESRFGDRPFILALWSLTCPPCLHELEMLGEWHKVNPTIPLVLVSTDPQEEADRARDYLRQHGLAGADNWIFADAFVEKLRFSIDSKWRGELPRSYLYWGGERQAISGALTSEMLQNWQGLLQQTQPQREQPATQ